MRNIKVFMIVMVFICFVASYAFSSVEDDANTNGISVVTSESSVYIHWNNWSAMKYYEFTVEDIYGSYSQRFTLFENYKSIGLTEPGVYKVTLEGFDGASSVPFDMGYYYFPFGYGSSTIDPNTLADMIANKLNVGKEIESKVFTFRTVWNDGWWSAFSLANTTDSQASLVMKVIDVKLNSLASTALTIQPNDILSNTSQHFLSFVNIDTETTDSDNFIVTFEVPVGVDVEFYLGQLQDGKINGLTKDTTIDSYIYKESSEE